MIRRSSHSRAEKRRTLQGAIVALFAAGACGFALADDSGQPPNAPTSAPALSETQGPVVLLPPLPVPIGALELNHQPNSVSRSEAAGGSTVRLISGDAKAPQHVASVGTQSPSSRAVIQSDPGNGQPQPSAPAPASKSSLVLRPAPATLPGEPPATPPGEPLASGQATAVMTMQPVGSLAASVGHPTESPASGPARIKLGDQIAPFSGANSRRLSEASSSVPSPIHDAFSDQPSPTNPPTSSHSSSASLSLSDSEQTPPGSAAVTIQNADAAPKTSNATDRSGDASGNASTWRLDSTAAQLRSTSTTPSRGAGASMRLDDQPQIFSIADQPESKSSATDRATVVADRKMHLSDVAQLHPSHRPAIRLSEVAEPAAGEGQDDAVEMAQRDSESSPAPLMRPPSIKLEPIHATPQPSHRRTARASASPSQPPATELALPSETELALPSATELALPPATELALPSETELALPSATELAAPNRSPAITPNDGYRAESPSAAENDSLQPPRRPEPVTLARRDRDQPAVPADPTHSKTNERQVSLDPGHDIERRRDLDRRLNELNPEPVVAELYRPQAGLVIDMEKSTIDDEGRPMSPIRQTAEREAEKHEVFSAPMSAEAVAVHEAQTKSLSPELPVRRVHLLNREVCEVVLVNPYKLLLIGRQLGTTKLAVWYGDAEQPELREIQVINESAAPLGASLSAVAQRLSETLVTTFPASRVQVIVQGDGLAVVGQTEDEQTAREVLRLVRSACLKRVDDRLTIRR